MNDVVTPLVDLQIIQFHHDMNMFVFVSPVKHHLKTYGHHRCDGAADHFQEIYSNL